MKAFIPGGGSAPWFFGEHLDLPLEARTVSEAGSMLGSGAIVVMDETTDAVKACLRLVRFYANESCGKCAPCREGTSWEQKILQRIHDGEGRPSDIDLLLSVGNHISPGPYPVASFDAEGFEAVPFPPSQTHHLPARAVVGGTHHIGDSSVPRGVRGPDHPQRLNPRRVGGGRMSDETVDDTVEISVNGTQVAALPGELLIDACERTGTYIPRFCHHSRLEPVGMCRMCLVEVDTGRGPALQPSCMLTCTPGMQVDTESERTRSAQNGVLELLLVNHPLDCPVCDKGGECPLQDQTMTHGPGESRYIEEKRHFVKPIPVNTNVLLDRERCVLCDRCTRFADQVAGDRLIHFLDRGSRAQVNTFPGEPFSSYFSGNTVQICPVGALTAAPYRFRARPWDLEEVGSTSVVDSVGSRISVHSSRGRVLRFMGADSDAVNVGLRV